MRFPTLLSLLLSFAACDSGVTGWQDCDGEECLGAGDSRIASAEWSCEGDDSKEGEPPVGSFHFDAVVDGWAGGVDLTIVHTAAPNDPKPLEEHGLVHVDYDETQDFWALDLTTIPRDNPWVGGVSTNFRCGLHDEDDLTFHMMLLDDLSSPVECVVWGHDVGFFAADGCRGI